MLLVISQRAELEDTMLESARVRCLFEGEGSQQKLEQLGLQRFNSRGLVENAYHEA